MHREHGFTLVEILVSMTIMLFILLAVLGVYSQGSALKNHVEGSVKIQNNVRVAMDRIERDMRMIGYGVPNGQEIGKTTIWTPVVFYASPVAIGFRAEIDGGRAEIVCTPKSTNSDCPTTKLRLGSIEYYEDLDCSPPDGQPGDLKLLAVLDGSEWSPISCFPGGSRPRGVHERIRPCSPAARHRSEHDQCQVASVTLLITNTRRASSSPR